MTRKLSSQVSRRAFVVALFASAASPVLAGAPTSSLRPKLRGSTLGQADEVNALLRGSHVTGDIVFAVADAATGDILESRNEIQGVAPASVAKSITALYALDNLGPAHRFKTTVVTTGPINNGILEGDLVLVGGCDPTLDTKALADLAGQLKEAGLREVRGKFLIYENELQPVHSIDPDQPDHLGYSPAVSGIALNYNRVHFQWKRASGKYTITMDARAAPYRPDVVMARMKIVERSAPVYTYADAGNADQWTVARGALGSEGSRWLPIRRPGRYAGDVFATLARSHGIVLSTPELVETLPEGDVVASVSSPPMREILQGMLKYSNNLTAEMVGLAVTRKRAGKATSLAASAQQMNLWAVEKLGMVNPAFVDHSGLGAASRVSPRDMVRALSAVHREEILRPILKPVNLLDKNGRPTHSHPVKVDAKTGTLNFVSGLAGYITAPGGREMVFAIFCADESIRGTITRANRERPRGARPWATRARRLQRKLLGRWGTVYAEQENAALDTKL